MANESHFPKITLDFQAKIAKKLMAFNRLAGASPEHKSNVEGGNHGPEKMSVVWSREHRANDRRIRCRVASSLCR